MCVCVCVCVRACVRACVRVCMPARVLTFAVTTQPCLHTRRAHRHSPGDPPLVLSEGRLPAHPGRHHHAHPARAAHGSAHAQDELQHVRLHVRLLAADGHRGRRPAGERPAGRGLPTHDLHDGDDGVHHHDPHEHLRRRDAVQLRGAEPEGGRVEGAPRPEVRPALQGLRRLIGAHLRRDPVPRRAVPGVGVGALAATARGLLRVVHQGRHLHRAHRRHRHDPDIRAEAHADPVSAATSQ